MELPFIRRLKEIEGRGEAGVSIYHPGKRLVTVDQQIIYNSKIVKYISPTIRKSENYLKVIYRHQRKGDQQCILFRKLVRAIQSKDTQRVSRFFGWVTKLNKKVSRLDNHKLSSFYLIPLNDYSTVVELIIQKWLQSPLTCRIHT